MRKHLFIALALSTATAASAAPDWNKVDSRTETTYRIANWGILGGITASLVGGLSGNRTMENTGGFVYTGSMATAAGASLRQRRSIVERGVPTTAAWGYSSWALQATAVGLGASSQIYMRRNGYEKNDRKVDPDHMGMIIGMSLGSLACQIGAILTASKQHKENAYKRSLIGRSEAPQRSLTVSVQPTVGVNGEPGLAAVGLF